MFSKFSKFQISLDPFSAMQRYALFSQSIYPQYITWIRGSGRPFATQKSKLFPWFLFFGMTLLSNLYYLYIILYQILSYAKDPDISTREVITLLVFFGPSMVSLTNIVTYVLKSSEICFISGNLHNLKESGKLQGKLIFSK